jgi:hypothetical protein
MGNGSHGRTDHFRGTIYRLPMKFDLAIWIAFVMLGGFILFGVTGIGSPPFVLTATKYAPGYSEAAFRCVKIGDSTNTVFQTLGQPLWQTRYDNGESLWSYSTESWTFWSERRWLWFSNDVVMSKTSDVYDL